MSSEQGDRPPWDPANGLRVGLVAGALVGAAALAAGDLSNIWIVVVSAGIGGAIGYWWERHRQPDP